MGAVAGDFFDRIAKWVDVHSLVAEDWRRWARACGCGRKPGRIGGGPAGRRRAGPLTYWNKSEVLTTTFIHLAPAGSWLGSMRTGVSASGDERDLVAQRFSRSERSLGRFMRFPGRRPKCDAGQTFRLERPSSSMSNDRSNLTQLIQARQEGSCPRCFGHFATPCGGVLHLTVGVKRERAPIRPTKNTFVPNSTSPEARSRP